MPEFRELMNEKLAAVLLAQGANSKLFIEIAARLRANDGERKKLDRDHEAMEKVRADHPDRGFHYDSDPRSELCGLTMYECREDEEPQSWDPADAILGKKE